MLRSARPGATLFIVVDEVSQYVHDDDGPDARAPVFVVGARPRLKGKAWLLATGQQKLEDAAGDVASSSR